MMMNWRKLLSTRRFGQSDPEDIPSVRSAFQKDWDRVVFSSAFRRLQDKTQVHSLSTNDYVRTRLTHSLEVSSVGRSLGAEVGRVILQREPSLADFATAADFGHIVAAACLAHDIGNPPFGHYGEDAIQHWFKADLGADLINPIESDLRLDFERFEGNAQGFRILTRLQNWHDQGGLRLTAATLATFTKYPRAASAPQTDLKDAGSRKFGFFQADASLFSEVARHVELIETAPQVWRRHPLAFLVEAADDTCYQIIDLEDGYKIGRVAFREVEELLIGILGDRPPRYNEIEEDSQRIGYLRAKSIGALIGAIVEVFLDEETQIRSGKTTGALMERISQAPQLDLIANLTRHRVFQSRERTEMEIAGGEILITLLQNFAKAKIAEENARIHGKTLSPRDAAILRLLPSHPSSRSRYEKLLEVTDYISGMTDSYALSQFRLIKGLTQND